MEKYINDHPDFKKELGKELTTEDDLKKMGNDLQKQFSPLARTVNNAYTKVVKQQKDMPRLERLVGKILVQLSSPGHKRKLEDLEEGKLS